MQRLLLDRVPATEVLWQDGRWAALRLADVVQPGMVDFSGRA
jgi:hypothetical protein